MVVTEEIKNLRRLEAQRNELNAKGLFVLVYFLLPLSHKGTITIKKTFLLFTLYCIDKVKP